MESRLKENIHLKSGIIEKGQKGLLIKSQLIMSVRLSKKGLNRDQ